MPSRPASRTLWPREMMPLAASYSLAEIEEKPSGTRPRQCTISTELGLVKASHHSLLPNLSRLSQAAELGSVQEIAPRFLWNGFRNDQHLPVSVRACHST